MTSWHIEKSTLQGTLEIPPSKSQTLRALLFAFMAKGRSRICSYLDGLDTHAMIAAITLLGGSVKIFPTYLEVEGVDTILKPAEDVIQAGNSGIVLRFIGALAALLPTYTVITGDHSIRHLRPVKPLLDALEGLGAFAKSSRGDGHAPILIKGPMTRHHTTLQGEDSQPVSGMLIASAFRKEPTTISVINPGEKPWIEMTLDWFRFLGIPYVNEAYTTYTLYGNASYQGFEYHVPGDWTTSAYPIAAALITGSELTLKNIDIHSKQGDKKLIEILQKMGAKIEWEQGALKIKRGQRLQGISIDVNDCIDCLPILAVMGCFATGATVITGGAIAKQKECNRIRVIAEALRKMNGKVRETEDGLVIEESSLHAAHLHPSHDHRIALSLCVAALGAKGSSLIENTECTKKTYPNFLKDFQSIGVNIKAL